MEQDFVAVEFAIGRPKAPPSITDTLALLVLLHWPVRWHQQRYAQCRTPIRVCRPEMRSLYQHDIRSLIASEAVNDLSRGHPLQPSWSSTACVVVIPFTKNPQVVVTL